MIPLAQVLSRLGSWQGIRSLTRHPLPVLGRIFCELARVDERKLSQFLGARIGEINGYFNELYRERTFFKEIGSKQEMVIRKKIRGGMMDRREARILYALVRHLRMDVAVETGVANGFSTAHILLAMDHNGKGNLYSIDFPNRNAWTGAPCQMLPEGKTTGWLIPEYLKRRWTLFEGDARNKLPEVLRGLAEGMDLFLHDSLHTYEHMMWEFENAWPYLRRGGTMIADDVHAHRAIQDFSSQTGGQFLSRHGLGILRKNGGELS